MKHHPKFGEMLSVAEASERLGVSTSTLAKWRSERKGPVYIKFARKITYPLLCVDEWLERNAQVFRNEKI